VTAADPGVALHETGIELDARNVGRGWIAAVGGDGGGTPGVTGADAAEAAPVPTAFEAVTVNR
jgi:hypothetical protein